MFRKGVSDRAELCTMSFRSHPVHAQCRASRGQDSEDSKHTGLKQAGNGSNQGKQTEEDLVPLHSRQKELLHEEHSETVPAAALWAARPHDSQIPLNSGDPKG